MHVFLSWSGSRSKSVSIILYEWLKAIVQASIPWMSDRDIEAGQRWNEVISARLRDTEFGVICLTPENLTAPWLLFEAGALAKSVDAARVVPVLFGIGKADLKFPLAQFQAVECDRDGLFALAKGINQALGEKQVPLETLNTVFTALWPALAAQLALIPEDAEKSPADPPRSDRDLLEEVLDSVRSFQRGFRSSRAAEAALSLGNGLTWEDHYIRGVNLANSRAGSHSDQDALEAYAQAIALVPVDVTQNVRSRLYTYRAAMLRRLGRFEEAKQDLDLAARWASEKREIEDTMYNAACLSAMQGNISEAIELIRTLVSHDAKWKEVIRRRMRYFASLQDNAEFLHLIREV